MNKSIDTVIFRDFEDFEKDLISSIGSKTNSVGVLMFSMKLFNLNRHSDFLKFIKAANNKPFPLSS